MSVRKNRGFKILTLALIAIFALAMVFGFAACGGESDMTDKDASKLNDAVKNTVKYDEDIEDESNQSVTVEITYKEDQTLSNGVWSGGDEAKITYAYNDIYRLVYYKIEEGNDSFEMYVRNKKGNPVIDLDTLSPMIDEDEDIIYEYYATAYYIDENGNKSREELTGKNDLDGTRILMAEILEMSGLSLDDKDTVSKWESEFLSTVGADSSTAVESKKNGNEYSFTASTSSATYSEVINVKSKKITSVDIVMENGSSRDEIATTISYSYDSSLADKSFGLLSDRDANESDEEENLEEDLWINS